jgi:hypothetical protein
MFKILSRSDDPYEDPTFLPVRQDQEIYHIVEKSDIPESVEEAFRIVLTYGATCLKNDSNKFWGLSVSPGYWHLTSVIYQRKDVKALSCIDYDSMKSYDEELEFKTVAAFAIVNLYYANMLSSIPGSYYVDDAVTESCWTVLNDTLRTGVDIKYVSAYTRLIRVLLENKQTRPPYYGNPPKTKDEKRSTDRYTRTVARHGVYTRANFERLFGHSLEFYHNAVAKELVKRVGLNKSQCPPYINSSDPSVFTITGMDRFSTAQLLDEYFNCGFGPYFISVFTGYPSFYYLSSHGAEEAKMALFSIPGFKDKFVKLSLLEARSSRVFSFLRINAESVDWKCDGNELYSWMVRNKIKPQLKTIRILAGCRKLISNLEALSPYLMQFQMSPDGGREQALVRQINDEINLKNRA